MKRSVALVLGAAALAAAAAATTPARAAERGGEKKHVEKHVVIRHAGGAGGFLGVTLDDVAANARGAKVQAVESESPAAKAGLQQGDVIVRFDGEAVKSAAQFARLVRETPPQRAVAIEVTRGGTKHELTATLGEGDVLRMAAGPHVREFRLPSPPADALVAPAPPHAPGGFQGFRMGPGEDMLFHFGHPRPRRLGIEFIDMGEQLAARYGLSARSGVLVTSVDADGAAAKAGLEAGDVVLSFDGRKVEDAEDLRDAVSDAEGGKALRVEVWREGRTVELQATLAKPEKEKALRDGGEVL